METQKRICNLILGPKGLSVRLLVSNVIHKSSLSTQVTLVEVKVLMGYVKATTIHTKATVVEGIATYPPGRNYLIAVIAI